MTCILSAGAGRVLRGGQVPWVQGHQSAGQGVSRRDRWGRAAFDFDRAGGWLLRHSYLETVAREHSHPPGQMGGNPAESISAAGPVSESVEEECILPYPIATESLSQTKCLSGGRKGDREGHTVYCVNNLPPPPRDAPPSWLARRRRLTPLTLRTLGPNGRFVPGPPVWHPRGVRAVTLLYVDVYSRGGGQYFFFNSPRMTSWLSWGVASNGTAQRRILFG